MQTKVGAHGFVSLINTLGTDATVVNAARVSFGKKVVEIREQDKALLGYLADHEHTSPFRHAVLQFHIKAPIYVARQFWKHIVGSDYSFKDTAWNEISGRYVELGDEVDCPVWREKNAAVKQGSAEEFDPSQRVYFDGVAEQAFEAAWAAYKHLLDCGVAPEQARVVLPVATMTEWYWTASLQAVFHLVKLRTDSHAQKEIQEFAAAIGEQALAAFPNAWAALKGAS